MFFIRSIVRPVARINETAKLIAKGDFNARVESSNNNDEISELCDTVNYMSEEIIREREEISDQIKALNDLKTMALKYGIDIEKKW